MKILRSVNRRGFRIESAGYFTVLKPNTWFAATRLSGGFHHLLGQSKGNAVALGHENPTAAFPPASASVPERKALVHTGSREAAMPSLIVISGAQNHRLMRPATIVLAATAITWIFLWWVSVHP